MTTKWDKEREQINNFCSLIGKDPLLVQGAGGNISSKDGNAMWIKASGVSLAQANEEDIFLPVDLSLLKTALNKKNFTVKPHILAKTNLRPSIETLLHALMPQKIVVHLHAIEPLAYLVRKNAFAALNEKMLKSNNWIYVEYKRPGAELAHAISRKLETKPNAELVFMKNHGIVIGANTLNGINIVLSDLLEKMTLSPVIKSNAKPPFCDENLKRVGYIPCQDGGVNQLAVKSELVTRLKFDWALYPDHLVFLGKNPAILDQKRSFTDIIKQNNRPKFIFALGRGVYQHKSVTSAHQAQIRCYFDVLSRQTEQIKLSVLSEYQIDEILNWDAEHYRQNKNTIMDIY